MMKKKTRKLVYTLLAVFLLAMMVMTLVSRIMNQSHIPEVETQTPRSSILVLDAIGRGVVRFGTPVDSRIEKKLFSEDTYYVEGYFFEKDSLKNVPEGSTIDLSVGGETLEGILEAKMYNYREDTMDVVISLPKEISLPEGNSQQAGKAYTAGSEVEFVLKEARVKYPTCISKDLVYEEDGEFYIYTLKEQDSILGNITIAVKMQIHVVAQNDRAVAVSEELDSDIQIISKGVPLEDGMRVRKREW